MLFVLPQTLELNRFFNFLFLHPLSLSLSQQPSSTSSLTPHLLNMTTPNTGELIQMVTLPAAPVAQPQEVTPVRVWFRCVNEDFSVYENLEDTFLFVRPSLAGSKVLVADLM